MRNMDFWLVGFIHTIFVVLFVFLFMAFVSFFYQKIGLKRESFSLPPLPQLLPLYGFIFLISASFAAAYWNWHPIVYWVRNSLDFFTAEKLVKEGLIQALNTKKNVYIFANVADFIGAIIVWIVFIIIIAKLVKRIQNPA